MKAILFALTITCALCAKTADFTPVLDSVLSILDPYFEFGANAMEIMGNLLAEYPKYSSITCADDDFCIHNVLDGLIDLVVDNRDIIEDGIDIYKKYKDKKLQKIVDDFLSSMPSILDDDDNDDDDDDDDDDGYEPIEIKFNYTDVFGSDEIEDIKEGINETADEIISANSNNEIIKRFVNDIRDEAFKAVDALTSDLEEKIAELEKNFNKAAKNLYNGGKPKLKVGKLESMVKKLAKSLFENLEDFYKKYDRLSKRDADGQHTAEERSLMADTGSQIAKDSATFIESLGEVSGATTTSNKLLVAVIAAYLLVQ